MAQNDIYCAVCGAAFSIPLFSAISGQDENLGDGRPGMEDMHWLENVRFLYRSWTYTSTEYRRVNLSSLVIRHDDGKYHVTGYLPHDEFENPEPDSFTMFQPYEGHTLFSIPLHDACSKHLAEFLDYSVGITPSDYLGILFKTLRSFHDKASKTYRGKIRYGRIEKQQGQFWYPTLDTKAFVYDPFFTSSALNKYYGNLPEVERDRGGMSECGVCCMDTKSSRDPFGKLPPELLMLILMHLPLKSIACLRFASITTARLRLPGSFWKQRLKRDMPWLWDFPYQEIEQSSTNLDWLQIYKDIYIGSKANGKSQFLALANRQRIWRICEQIAPRFAEFQEERAFVQERERERSVVKKRDGKNGNQRISS